MSAGRRRAILAGANQINRLHEIRAQPGASEGQRAAAGGRPG